MRVVFCGSGSFAVPSLRAIAASSHELAGIITQPARPAGRGDHLRPTPVFQAAAEMGQSALECADINAPDGVQRVASFHPDVLVVADFGQLIHQAVRKLPPNGAFNLHGSLLPQLRGAAPVNWAIILGLKTTGVTTIDLAAKMDAGDIYLQASTDIRPDETAKELRGRLAELGAPLVAQTLDSLATGRAEHHPQDESGATFAPPLSKADGQLDWSADTETIRNRIHGTWPWPGGQSVFVRKDGRQHPVTLARAQVAEGSSRSPAGQIEADGAVATGSGRLRILEIQPAGKRVMTWRDFVNGYRAAEGDRFLSAAKT
jgi:methionyl-tRNA formyltransferase